MKGLREKECLRCRCKECVHGKNPTTAVLRGDVGEETKLDSNVDGIYDFQKILKRFVNDGQNTCEAVTDSVRCKITG